MRGVIQNTPDLQRILALPRRTLDIREATYHARELTRMLALDPRESLRPWQGQILHEAIMVGGVYAGAPVGLGKTLLGRLAGVVLDGKRVALIIPGGLRPDTQAMHRQYYGKWVPVPGGITIVSVDELARLENEDYLERMQFDTLIIDEADALKNPRSAAVKRIGRYVGKYLPNVCAWTGTPGRKSITDFAHILVWCLKDKAPVPLKRSEVEFWGLAIDEVSGYRAKARPHPGALERLGGGTEIDGVREAFQRRLHETPGVVIVDGDSCDQPLNVRQIVAPPSTKLEQHFKVFRTEHVTPDGWALSDSLSVYRHAGELGTEMYLRWNPRPPLWWSGPRKNFCSFVRAEVDADRGDTELAVIRANPHEEVVEAWLDVRDKFTPNSEPVWIGDGVLRMCAEWFAAAPRTADVGGSVVWCWTVAFGEALEVMTGFRYYGAGGYDRFGAHLSELPCYGRADREAPPIILSGQANLRGRNLQAWTRNLIVTPPRSAKYLEQMFGRTHRQGQTRPVTVDVLMTSGDTFDGFESSLAEARFGKAVFGITQKLLRAGIVYADVPQDSPFRWARRKRRSTGDE